MVDLLEDASAEGFAIWLKEHPGVEVISRDRGGAFAEGGREGAPEAIHVADRFHILKNLGEAIEEYLGRIRRQLPRKPRSLKAPVSPSRAATSSVSSPDSRRLLRLEQDRQSRRGRRVERYNAVIALHQKGVSARQIAQSLDLDRGTVRKYINADAFPERAPHAKRPSLLDPFRAYLQQRWDDGSHNGWQLFRKLKEKGFAGQRAIVTDAVTRMRQHRSPEDSKGIREVVEKAANRRMSPRMVRWWFQGKREDLEEAHCKLLDPFLADHAEARVVYALTQRFGVMVRERRVSELSGWLYEARQGPREL